MNLEPVSDLLALLFGKEGNANVADDIVGEGQGLFDCREKGGSTPRRTVLVAQDEVF